MRQRGHIGYLRSPETLCVPCGPDSTFLNSVMPNCAITSPYGTDASRMFHIIRLRRRMSVDMHSSLLHHDDLLCSSQRIR